MLHDETVYPEPFEFKPERFMKDGQLNPAVRDPDHAVFGFGRRWAHPYCDWTYTEVWGLHSSICPGRYMAFASAWIAVALLIAAFDMKKAVDENGETIEPAQEYLSSLVV
jgi:cytochrome P450